MFVFTNVSRSATVFCVKPFQNASPVSGPFPSGPSVWQLAQDWLKVAVARAAWASVYEPSHTVRPFPFEACAFNGAVPRPIRPSETRRADATTNRDLVNASNLGNR